MPETPTSADYYRFGDVVKIIKPGHPMNGRVGTIAAGLNHPSAIVLRPHEYWVELINNEGDKFYGRYDRSEIDLFYK